MASIYKRDGNGNWFASWFDHEGARVVRSTRTTDKRLAERLAQRWEDHAIERRSGLIDARAETLAAQEARPLADHRADFAAYLEAKGTSPETIDAADSRIARILTHAKAERIADLTPSAIMGAIQHLRTPGAMSENGLSAKTASHYVRAIKSFSRWLVRDKRTTTDPLSHLAGFNADTDRRRVRRDLTPDEVARLIDAAEKSDTVRVPRPTRDENKERQTTMVRMRCPDRAWAYRIAAGTGFRASEVASLTRESFDLDAETPTVTVEACYSKRKRRDVQPMRADLADQLRSWLRTKEAGTPVCPLPHGKAALLIRADLDAARAVWIAEATTPAERAKREASDFLRHTDSAGRVADFHGLRHTFISRVVQSGASVRVAQELARHSTPTLTIGRYSHARLNDLTRALDNLPAATTPAPGREEAKATGTHGANPEPIGRPARLQHQLQHSPHDSGRVRASGCESDSDDRTDAHRHKPLPFAGLGESMRSGSTGDESAEGRTRTADLRVMNPEEAPQNKPETDAIQHQLQHPRVESAPEAPSDPDLARVVGAWADLPPALRAGILAMVNAASPTPESPKGGGQ